ncbi:hypothetical protein H4W80_011107 [Nonomuraea angiospora]|uniref:Uncharacterized protein n=1 Tax=Nonomuraea angiospora TaxID=46172 RepID=A0ABR9MIT4_9ACTN|nr:hypothetical protein [Nonomuraea angiospora]
MPVAVSELVLVAVPVSELVPVSEVAPAPLEGLVPEPPAGLEQSGVAAGLPEARATMVSCWPRRLVAGGCRPATAVKGVPGAGGRRRPAARMTSRRATPISETGRPAATSPRPMRSVVTGRSAGCGPSPKGPDLADPAADVRQASPMEVVRHPEAAVVVRRPGPKAAVRRLRPTAVVRRPGRTAAVRRQEPTAVARRREPTVATWRLGPTVLARWLEPMVAGWWPGPMAVGRFSGPRTIGRPTTVRWASGPTVDFRLLRPATGRPTATGGRGSSRVRDGVRRLLTGSSRCSPTWACNPSSSG